MKLLHTITAICLSALVSNAFGNVSDRNVVTGLVGQIAPLSEKLTLSESEAGVEKQAVVNLNLNVAEDAIVYGDLVELSLFEDEYLVSFDSTQVGSPGVVTYVGSMYNTDFEQVSGRVLLTSGDGAAHGFIVSPTGVYRILPTLDERSTAYRLQKMGQKIAPGITDFDEKTDPSEFTEVGEESAIASLTDEGLGAPVTSALSMGTTVDLMVLYTPSAKSSQGGTTATVNWINTIVANYNQRLVELGISTYSLSLKVAIETKWPTFPTTYHESSTHNVPVSTACFGGACDSLISDQHWVATNSTVASLRTTHSADLVVLITANSQKHFSDVLQGYAGWKILGVQGHACSGRTCGDFATVRDTFALSNLTFDHEVGHAFGMTHAAEGVLTFGTNTSGVVTTVPGHKTPFTLMEAKSPICLWSFPDSEPSCHMRLPFYSDNVQYRNVYYYTMPVPRKFDPSHHAETRLKSGMDVAEGRK